MVARDPALPVATSLFDQTPKYKFSGATPRHC